MAYVSRKSAVLYVTEEVTEGTAVDPTLGSQAVGILADGFEMNPDKETVERSLLRSGIARQIPRTGIKTSSCTAAVEAAANGTAGEAPDYDLLMKSLLGGKRQITSQVTTKATGNTASELQIEDADIADFEVGDIVLILEAGAYHTSPVTAVDDTVGAANITLLIAGGSAFSASVVIEKVTTYYGANTGHSSLTFTSYWEDAIKKQSAGCKVSSMSLDTFETGQLASFNFSLTGLTFTQTLASSGLTPSFSNAEPPVILEACVYVDGAQLPVNSLSLTIDNTNGRVTATCNANGVIAQRATERAVSGSMTPYLDTTSVDLFDKFDGNTEFPIFLRAWNPTGTTGEKKEAFGIFIPKSIITALPEQDADGVMQYSLEFQSGEDSSGTYPSDIYISFS